MVVLTFAMYTLLAADGGFDVRMWLDPTRSESHRPPVRPPFQWDVPDLVEFVDVPGVTMADMVPVRFNAAISKQDVKTLGNYYAKRFVGAGLYVAPADQQLALDPGTVQVSGLDTETMISYVVILRPIDRRSTRVIMAEAAMKPFIDAAQTPGAAPGDFAPVMPGAKNAVRTRTEGVELIQFATSESPDTVRAFYRQALVAGGYQEGPDGFTRGAEMISVSPLRQERETWVMLRRTRAR